MRLEGINERITALSKKGLWKIKFVILTNYSWLLASVEVSTVTMVKEQYREADVAKKM